MRRLLPCLSRPPLSAPAPPAARRRKTRRRKSRRRKTSGRQPDLPTGEDLFAKHLTAVGGLDAIKAQKTIVARGTFARTGSASGLLTIYRRAPNTMYKILEVPATVTVETWCDGERAWVRNSNKGSGKLTGANLEAVKQEARVIGESDYKESFKSLATTDKTTFADRPAYTVAAVAPMTPSGPSISTPKPA
jgi:hypothetical protein